MTEIFAEDGKRIPVTLIEAGPCAVTQVKTEKNSGYSAIQVGYEKTAPKKTSKSRAKKPFRFIKECRVGADVELNDGDDIKAADFEEGDIVKISGITKGKGFQGAVKRHGFKGRQTCTHGTKHELRNLGSVGMGEASIRKGKKMPGRMGACRATVKNLKIAKIDCEKNIIAIRGAVPGARGTLLEIRKN